MLTAVCSRGSPAAQIASPAGPRKRVSTLGRVFPSLAEPRQCSQSGQRESSSSETTHPLARRHLGPAAPTVSKDAGGAEVREQGRPPSSCAGRDGRDAGSKMPPAAELQPQPSHTRSSKRTKLKACR